MAKTPMVRLRNTFYFKLVLILQVFNLFRSLRMKLLEIITGIGQEEIVITYTKADA